MLNMLEKQELFEWAGFEREEYHEWHDPNGFMLTREAPPLDMNTLFRWFVPKLYEKDYWITLLQGGYEYWHVQVQHWVDDDSYVMVRFSPEPVSKDPTEALAEAIYKVIKNGSPYQ